MSQPSSRSVDARANLLRGLKVLQSLGDAIPGPGGGVIKGIAGIGVVVLETAEVSSSIRTQYSATEMAYHSI